MAQESLLLRRKLQQLPQELYDDIYNLTFTPDSKIRCFGHPKDRPDAAMKVADHFSLHLTYQSAEVYDVTPFSRDSLFYVSRASRRQYAASFFQSVIINGVAHLSPFLEILDPEHRLLIGKLQVGWGGPLKRTEEHLRRLRAWRKWKIRQRWGYQITDKIVFNTLGHEFTV
ncbi:uncharacterized protein RHO25_007267 [Cercospora beticola]|uniref:Uncharacterized protein n=1 Tax=Cercospora beticola TaxID=122368 RepID=A0ABZ0NT22_CERBT|nr:hypothetical protein RHO25_007267 [Cercospora beticola]